MISDHRIPADQVRLSPVETAATPAFRASIRPESSRTPRSFVTEALYGLPGEFCDEDEVLVEMENGAVVQFGCGAISRRGSTGRDAVRARPAGVVPARPGPRPRESGTPPASTPRAPTPGPRASSMADRAENPASRRVTVVMVTGPCSFRSADCSASGLEPSRTNADLTISQDVLMTRRRT